MYPLMEILELINEKKNDRSENTTLQHPRAELV